MDFSSRFPAGVLHEGTNTFKGKLYSALLAGTSPWVQLYINNKVFAYPLTAGERGVAV